MEDTLLDDTLPDDPLPFRLPPRPALNLAALPDETSGGTLDDGEESGVTRPLLPPEPLFSAPLPLSLAYSACPTLGEFLAAHAGDPALLLLERRLREVRIPPDDQSFYAGYPDTLHMAAVVNIHLPDTPAVLPLWVRMAIACPRADLRVLNDDNLAPIQRLIGDEATLDLEALELPALLIFDDEWQFQAHWGPRPQAAEPSIDEWLAHHPDYERLVEAEAQGPLDAGEAAALADLHRRLMLQMRIWYNSGLDAEGSAELRALLASLLDETEAAARLIVPVRHRAG